MEQPIGDAIAINDSSHGVSDVPVGINNNGQ